MPSASSYTHEVRVPVSITNCDQPILGLEFPQSERELLIETSRQKLFVARSLDRSRLFGNEI